MNLRYENGRGFIYLPRPGSGAIKGMNHNAEGQPISTLKGRFCHERCPLHLRLSA